MTKVSVVVAAYDEEAHIGRLLQALREQTHEPLEVIVADDGSRDRTADVTEAAGARVLRLAHRGPAVARNEAARVARGDVLALLDGDMTCEPEFLERLVEPIAEGRAIGTFTREMYIGNTENRWARAYAALRWSPPDRWDNFRAIRRDSFLSVGGYDDVGYGEDRTLAAKLGETAAGSGAGPRSASCGGHGGLTPSRGWCRLRCARSARGAPGGCSRGGSSTTWACGWGSRSRVCGPRATGSDGLAVDGQLSSRAEATPSISGP